MPVRGSCHCGKVTFRLDDEPAEAVDCNCSICRRKGYLLTFAPAEQFHLETSRDALAVYTFASGNIRHQFCKHCGCATFGEGTGPDGKSVVAVNLRCVDDLDLAKLKVTHFDGASL